MSNEEPKLFESYGNMIFNGNDIGVKLYRRGHPTVVVVFMSAGGSGRRGREEFKLSLEKYAVDIVFVNDYNKLWYNTLETFSVFEILYDLTRTYERSVAVGASMGGSGAILATQYLKNLSRVLEFSPQYSIKPPFIEFDEYYRDVGKDRLSGNYQFSNYAENAKVEICQILYGYNHWQDYIHQSMFKSWSFAITNTNSPHHAVAEHLKHHGALERLLDVFMDFSGSWSLSALRQSIIHFVTPVSLSASARACETIETSC